MQYVNDSFQIESPLDFPKDKKILGLSDLHYRNISQNFYYEKLFQFYRYLIQSYRGKVDLILIPGDLIFCLGKSFDNQLYFSQLKYDLQMLSDDIGAPICISLGNHDLPFSTMSEEDKKNYDMAKHLDNRSKGIFVLDNEQAYFGDICVTGFSPERNCYGTGQMPNPALENARKSFLDCHFSFSAKDINILMSHDNKFFTYPEIASQYGELYEYLTLILGGHLHDGYIPHWLQRICGSSLKDNGFWEKVPPRIDMCRGAFIVSQNHTSDVILSKDFNSIVSLKSEEAASVVLRGVAKYSWIIPSTPTYSEIDIVSQTRKKTL